MCVEVTDVMHGLVVQRAQKTVFFPPDNQAGQNRVVQKQPQKRRGCIFLLGEKYGMFDSRAGLLTVAMSADGGPGRGCSLMGAMSV